MANLVISRVCDLACSYCFARETLQTGKNSSTDQFLSLEAYDERLSFLARSGIKTARLLGGEPTLHPQFIILVERALQRDLHVMIFSHGWFSLETLSLLKNLPAYKITVLINLNAEKKANPIETDQRLEIMRGLGDRVLPGYNIHSTNFDLEPVIKLIVETGIRRELRLGLAHPILGGQNLYLHPKDYPLVGEKIARFAGIARRFDVKFIYDCGFVRCMFSRENLDVLEVTQKDLQWRCSPIVDLDLDGRAYHCFSLAGRVQCSSGDLLEADEIRRTLHKQIEPYRIAGIYRECSGCNFKQSGECTGGCMAIVMKRFRRAQFKLSALKPDGSE